MSLRLYDFVVGFLSHRFIWRCPRPIIEALYTSHVGQEHLEVGPGTGHTLARLPTTTPLCELHMLDVNPACLQRSAARVRGRFDCHLYKAGALGPWPVATASMDSVAASDVIHCLPGSSIDDKRSLVDNAARVLRPGGTLFGVTFLGEQALGHTRAARKLLALYNSRANTLHNRGDTLADLHRVLVDHPDLTQEWVDTSGSVALFRARRVGGDQG